MNDSLTKRESISTSAKHRDGVSPTPWRIADGMHETIVDSLNRVQANAANAEMAAYIVEVVNNFELLIQDRRRLIWELDSVKAQLDWHKRQLKAVKSDAESQERWANQYFEQAQKAEAERDRIHDLVRRLAQRLQMARLEGFGGPDRETLLDEAREAISEWEDA